MKNVVTHQIELSESSPSKKESNSPTKVNRQSALAKNAAGGLDATLGRSPNQINVRKSVIGKLPGQVGSHLNLMSDVHNEKGVGK